MSDPWDFWPPTNLGWVEGRAAEIAADYEPSLHDALFDGADDEQAGWQMHRDDSDVPRTDEAWAGWLAREIYDTDLIDEEPDDAR